MTSILRFSRRSLIKGLAAAPLATPAILGRARAADAIRIGISGPMTGQFAQNGQWMRNGVSIAVKQANEKGGIKGRMIEVRIADDLGPNPTAAGNAVTKLATQDEVVALVGPHYTPGHSSKRAAAGEIQSPVLNGRDRTGRHAAGKSVGFSWRYNMRCSSTRRSGAQCVPRPRTRRPHV
jgi:branched-chain amino acid transport system substrate-binding protein